MARPLRILFPGAWYHVMNRGLNRSRIFQNTKDKDWFLKILSDSVRDWKIRIHAYSLMPNHYHLLIETPLGNLSRAMRHIDGVYTQVFNRCHKRDGHIFRGRYKSILIDKDSYFLEILRYIHLNSTKANLVKSPEEDPYTSHMAYLYKHKRPHFLTVKEFLSQIQSPGQHVIDVYRRFIQEGVNRDLTKQLASKKWPVYLGSKKFIEDIKKKYPSKHYFNTEIPQAKEIEDYLDPNIIIQKVCDYFKITRDMLCQKNSSKNNTPRKITMYLLKYRSGLSYSQIGNIMGAIGRGAIAPACMAIRRKKPKEMILFKRATGIKCEI